MRSFLLRLIISALSLALAAAIVPGVVVDGAFTLILAAFLMGIVNAVVRPILIILTLPLTMITLGLFLLVVNAASFSIVALLLPGFRIAGFGSALLGWLIVWLSGTLASKLLVEDR